MFYKIRYNFLVLKSRGGLDKVDSIMRPAPAPKASWTFFTNHSHVVFLLARHPSMTLRELALKVGITERAVLRIIEDLVEAEFVERSKQGRNNTYRVHLKKQLRHPNESHRQLAHIFKALYE